jgi:P27 family predicted phage terminase small subunit
MGRKGPAPAPGKVLQLRGRYPNEVGNEPVPPNGELEPPEGLTTRARPLWDEVVPALRAMGVVYPVDRAMIAAWCEAEAERRRLAQMVAASTPLLQTSRSDRPDLVRNPLMTMFVHTTTLVMRLSAELGLSPRGRAELKHLQRPSAAVELERLLS